MISELIIASRVARDDELFPVALRNLELGSPLFASRGPVSDPPLPCLLRIFSSYYLSGYSSGCSGAAQGVFRDCSGCSASSGELAEPRVISA